MKAHELRPNAEARRERRRVGRGNSSGIGNYATRGVKGQKSRSGGKVRPGFEGGQIPKTKGMPMLRGFTNVFREEYHEVNLQRLASFAEGTAVTPDLLRETGIVKGPGRKVKILGRGTVRHPIKVSAHKFSASASAAIEAAGGTVEVLS